MQRSIATRAGLAVASLALGVLLVFNFKAPDDVVVGSTADGTGPGTTGSGASGTTGTGGSTGGATTAPGATGSGSTSGGGTAGSGAFTGSLINTRYGPVQVQITVSNGKITAVTATQLPSGGRSGMISAYVEPILSSEALTAQSAQIDLVSGATYTSNGYERSLQAALDKAGL